MTSLHGHTLCITGSLYRESSGILEQSMPKTYFFTHETWLFRKWPTCHWPKTCFMKENTLGASGPVFLAQTGKALIFSVAHYRCSITHLWDMVCVMWVQSLMYVIIKLHAISLGRVKTVSMGNGSTFQLKTEPYLTSYKHKMAITLQMIISRQSLSSRELLTDGNLVFEWKQTHRPQLACSQETGI